ncbi:class I SAM-dependent methyltransferase [Pseudoalteromonas shioyasakiensis]|uniref:class I SAM-dependent methyltransferase n=1 Tax=Pseudoalteromonas shioyasakiensis TaxID=1190813 RepID=UPI00211957B8|nr:class I SAM-dependent methyltransferase [Pseudoalteromonas shioyasakiensis]MCQ8877117.1 class I SAM-dependent methyltransferase [Pseudoalteromonas shioyasakiensis]
MSKHWTNYWEQGFLTSFGGAFKGNYQGALKSFWKDYAQEIQTKALILDVGTGNGALIALLQDRTNLSFVGVDKAEVNKKITSQLNGEFYSNIDAKDMPFKDGMFDIVIGQFSMEYTGLNTSVAEIFRVLKPGGSYLFVCHSPDSIIIEPNSKILLEAESINSNILEDIYSLALAIQNKDESLTQTTLTKVNSYLDSRVAEQKKALTGTNLQLFIDFLLANKNKDIDFLKAVQLFDKELKLLILRLNELVNAANNTALLIEEFKSNSQVVNVGEIYENNELIAVYVKGNYGVDGCT